MGFLRELRIRRFPIWGWWAAMFTFGSIALTFTDPEYLIIGPILSVVGGWVTWKAWNRFASRNEETDSTEN